MSRLTVSAAAQAWVADRGGSLTVRTATRHGCCGGSAAVPVAEARKPDQPEAYEQHIRGDVTVYVALHLSGEPLSVDLDRFGPWTRLIVEGAVQALKQ